MRGRRRRRPPTEAAGSHEHSVTVTELIGQQPESVRTRFSDTDPTDHDRTADPAADPPLPRRRVVVGMLGTLLVCGSAVAGSAILSATPTDSPTPTAPPAPINGAEALRPDLLARAGRPFGGDGGYARVPEERAPTLPSPADRPPASPGPSELLEANPWVGSPDSALALVEDFYRLLGSDPRRAVRLVSPEVLGSQRAEVVRSWREVARVRLRKSHVRRDGSVVAEVVTGRANGTRLTMRHALTVEDGPRPMIVGVRLLTARRHPAAG